MVVLPADIVGEILSRLPVKPLLRFRSVCKIWCALIDSNHFIKLHLHRSIDTKTNRKFIIRSLRSIHPISLDSLDVAEKLDYPTGTSNGGPSLLLALRSCNGLLLLWTSIDISIWNPSTRKCQILPPPTINHPPITGFGLGFGYDAVNDDYKVVILNRFKRSHDTEMAVQVYSLKWNSWRVIKDFPYHPHRKGFKGVLAHGALHFRVTINSEEAHHDCSIAAFDLATEETRLMPLPEFGGNSVYMDLVALEGCLCIVAYDGVVGSGSDRKFLGVWVMKDDGVGGSWNKLISAAQSSVTWSFGKVFPLVYSKNGCEVLLQQDREFVWFDLENNAIRKIQVHGLPSDFRLRAQAFVQSLIPPGSGGKTNPVHQLIRDKKEKHQEDIGMKRKRGVSEP